MASEPPEQSTDDPTPSSVAPDRAAGELREVMNHGPGGIHPRVFWPALTVLVAVCGLSIAFPDGTGEFLGDVQGSIVEAFGWYYVLIVAGFVAFALWMGLSRFGDVRLGPDDEEPEFGLLTWFNMLFAAGMGIGLVFWGAAEPLTFAFSDVKPGVSDQGVDLAQRAMAQTFLHWGFHAWAIYVVVGLALAYSIHRKGHPVSIRWALEPLLGDRVRGWVGDLIDTLAVVGTVAGVATSLGFGVTQISAGLVHLGMVDQANDTLLVVLVVVITAIATMSVVSGVGRGIKWLSNLNLGLAAVFLLAILALGPTLFLLREWVQVIGVYLRDVLPLTFSTSAFSGEAGQAWQASWTTFYWGWWISWAPFVGVFIARISRGRTVGEFVAGVLLVPTLVTMLWFAVLGGTAIHRELFGEGGLVQEDADGNAVVVPEQVLFDLLDGLPGGTLLAGVAIVLITIFFITSSDSGSLVVDMLASGGDPEPPTWSRVLWSVIEGLVAIGLLLAGGLGALQTGAIITALPFSVVMIAICFATYRAMHGELAEQLAVLRRRRSDDFDQRLEDAVDARVEQLLAEKGRPGRRPQT